MGPKRERTASEAWRSSFHSTLDDLPQSERYSDGCDDGTTNTLFSSSKNALWQRLGQLSDRATEVFQDARDTIHGKESNLYEHSMDRLSASEDPSLASLGDYTRNSIENLRRESFDESSAKRLSDELRQVPPPAPTRASRGGSIELVKDFVPVRWEGILVKRSEWLRRWEKYYFVLEGRVLKRFASRGDYYNILNASPTNNKSSNSGGGCSHCYTIDAVRESTTKPNAFTITTTDGKNLLLSVSSSIEKVVWMRMILEATSDAAEAQHLPLDIEEFYAMMVVLYTVKTGAWSSEGDMGVTLPPPSDLVFSRFFALLDPEVILTSNYPPSVPFAGTYRGHLGLLQYIEKFSSHTKWTNFKIEGMVIDDLVAVASGKEELTNLKDSRKFLQSWVHKFTFTALSGQIARMEINGDVVAASAVYKVPGAATTLKLPKDYHELEVGETGVVSGTMTVLVIKANGLNGNNSGNSGSSKRTLRDPVIRLCITTEDTDSKNASDLGSTSSSGTASSTTSANTSSTTGIAELRRKLSSTIIKSTSSVSETSVTENDSSTIVASSGPPRNVDADSNPVWDALSQIPFKNVRRICWLNISVGERRGTEVFGTAKVNLVSYIKASKKKQQLSHEQEWFTLSNDRGEFCGKVLLTINCAIDDNERRGGNGASPGRKASVGMQWKTPKIARSSSSTLTNSSSGSIPDGRPRASTTASAPAQTSGTSTDDSGNSSSIRRRGWSSVSLISENNNFEGDDDNEIESTNISGDSHTFSVCGAPFVVPTKYNLIKVCGRGAYGIVIAASDTTTGGNVAIKKVIDCIWHPHQLKQVLREVRFMRQLKHENILSLMDLIPPPRYSDFRDVYMVVDLMEMDLHRIIYSKEVLSDDHIRYFLYQVLSGLKHMHAAGVIHRDLKPSNLLINSDCQLKICDFGLARRTETDVAAGQTEYVVTRWYRAPELLLGSEYNEHVDLWAAGCIFAEMLGRKPLFPGRSYVHQLQLIINLLGVPAEHSFKENPQAQKLKGRKLLQNSSVSMIDGADLSQMFTTSNPEAVDLLWKMLVFDVNKRISVEDALRHPYLASLYDEKKESVAVTPFKSFSLEGVKDADLKELMFKEICHFHPEQMELRAAQVAAMPEEEKLPPGWLKRESRSVPGKFYYTNPMKGISTWTKPDNII